MKKLLFLLTLTSAINLGAMEQESKKINLEVSLENSMPIYAFGSNYSTTVQIQNALNKGFNEKTLLQKVCILNPNASNKQPLEHIEIQNNVLKIPKYLPLESLPNKDGETKKLDLYFRQDKVTNKVTNKVTINLTANQKGLDQYEYNNKSFANLKRELARLAIEHPPPDKIKIDFFIKIGFLKKRWRWFGDYVPGSSNQYLPADKTDIYTLFGASSIAALGLFAWWKKWW